MALKINEKRFRSRFPRPPFWSWVRFLSIFGSRPGPKIEAFGLLARFNFLLIFAASPSRVPNGPREAPGVPQTLPGTPQGTPSELPKTILDGFLVIFSDQFLTDLFYCSFMLFWSRWFKFFNIFRSFSAFSFHFNIPLQNPTPKFTSKSTPADPLQ